MTQEQEQALRHFETRVRQLILHCGELARENERLAAEVEKRDGIIAQKDTARQRINTIIHEIDKSIALLNI